MNKKIAIMTVQISVLVISIFVVTCALLRGTQTIFSSLKDEQVGDIIVLGTCRNILEGWDIFLCWRRAGSQDWHKYLLAFETDFWKDVAIQRRADRIDVTNKKKILASLNTVNGSLQFPQYSPVRTSSNCQWIVHGDDPFLIP